MKLFQWFNWSGDAASKPESSTKENVNPLKRSKSKANSKSQSLPKSKSSIVIGSSDASWETLNKDTKKKKPSLVQKLRGYNELLDELQRLKLEYESVQREKITLRDRLSEETEKQRDNDDQHQSRVNGLLSEFKKVKIENDKLNSEMAHLKKQVIDWQDQFEAEKQNIVDLIESQCDAEVEIDTLRKDAKQYLDMYYNVEQNMTAELREARDQAAINEQKLIEMNVQQCDLVKSVSNKTREIDHLECENTSKQVDLERLQAENLDITQHMDDLKIEKEDVITQNVLLINQLSDKNDRIHAAIAERESLDREINRLEVTLEGNRREIANLKKQIVINDTEYRNQLADAESEFSDERAAHENEVNEWSERIDSLAEEKERLSEEKAQLTSDKDGLMVKLSELESDMAKINTRLDNVVEESASKTDNYIEQIKSFERQASGEREELEQKINELVTAKMELTQEVIELVTQANIATESNAELKQMNGELAKEIAKQRVIIHSQTNTNEGYLEKIHLLDTKLEAHIEELSENQARLQQLQTDQDGLRDDLNAKDAHLKDVLTENERLNGLIKEFEELQKPGDETLVIEGDSMEQLLVNLKTKEDENEQLQDENESYLQNSKLLAIKNRKLEVKVCKLLDEVTKIRDQEASLMSDKHQSAQLNAENDKLQTTINDLKLWDVKREAELIEAKKREENMKYLNRKLMERLITQQGSNGNNNDLVEQLASQKLTH